MYLSLYLCVHRCPPKPPTHAHKNLTPIIAHFLCTVQRAVDVKDSSYKLTLLYGSWEDQRRRQFNKFHNRANCSVTSQSRLYRTVSSSITTQIEKLQHVARWLLCATHQCFPWGQPQPCPRPPKKLLHGSPRKGVCACEATPMYYEF